MINSSQTKGLPGYMIIFENPVSSFRLTSKVPYYRISDPRFYDIATYFNYDYFMDLFNMYFENAFQSTSEVIILPYNPLMAKVVKIMLEKYFSEVPEAWKAVSFFHDDPTTARFTLSNGEDPLDHKFVLLKTLLDFPYIQKQEIPCNALLTRAYLQSLFF